tara:strand:+ start:2387 stop:2908 length:522 start_codon:yes stop_codon:yes gene_type:complete
MAEFDDNETIIQLMERVKALKESERELLVNSIKDMNTISKKREPTDEEKAERMKAAVAKRKETIARRKAEANESGESKPPAKKSQLTDEEKNERKLRANEKRKATWARKKQERDDMRVVEDTTSEEGDDKQDVSEVKPPTKKLIIKKQDVVKEDIVKEDIVKEDIVKEDIVSE